MRIFASVLTILLLVFPVRPAHMQDDVGPWPPEAPETLFGPRVEIIDARLDSVLFHRAHPATNAAEYRAVITADGRVYPWPDDFRYPGVTYSGEQLGLFSNQFYLASSASTSGEYESLWSLDLTTGVYTRYNRFPQFVDTYCGRLRLNSTLVNSWMIIVGVNRQQHVCNVADGRMSLPLPGEYSDWQIHHKDQTDGFVLLSAQRANQTDGMATLFAFNPAKRDLQVVGEFARDTMTRVSKILNESMQVLTTSSVPVPDPSEITYVVNIAEQRLFQIPSQGFYHEDPLRVEYFTPLDDDAACEIMNIDLLTENQTTYRLNTACYAEFEQGDRRYYRVLNDAGTQADVVRVNELTGDSSTLFSGEVERIHWVSDDERYLGLVIDSSGRVDTPAGSFIRMNGSTDAQWVLVDLTNESHLFETPAMIGGSAGIWYPIPHIVSDGWLALDGFTASNLLHIDDGAVIEPTTIQGGITLDIGNGWTIGYPAERINEYGNVASYSLYNIHTQEVVPLIDLGAHVIDYSFQNVPQYVGDNQFQVTLSFGGGEQLLDVLPLYDRVVYTIRIVGVEIEDSAAD
ncbi:MAG: hypothetical protein KC547_09360 [Anaerolineae bacterium]|nr:hypothetical protein [Anaerolineae bacterium]